jgi:hypothetical protein
MIAEVSYYILTQMEADVNDPYLQANLTKAKVVFRGQQMGEKLIPGHKEDFQLIAKEDEAYYIERTLPENQAWRKPTILPKFVNLPPLLKEILMTEARVKGIKFKESELKLPFIAKRETVGKTVEYRDN